MKKMRVMCAVVVAAMFVTPVFAALNDAVEMTGGEFSYSGVPWFVCSEEPYAGFTCIRCGDVDYYDSSSLTLEVDMPEAGPVSFMWRQPGSGNISLYIDDEWQEMVSGEASKWTQFSTELDAGAHTFKWSVEGSSWSEKAVLYLDKFSIPGHIVVDPDTQDPNNTLWTTEDGRMFRSGVITNGQYSTKTMTVDGKGILSFQWRTLSERYFDRLEASFDGKEIVPPISGETDWVKVAYTNDHPGKHTIRWEYWKDNDVSARDDSGFIRSLCWGDGTIPFRYDTGLNEYVSGKISNNETSEAELMVVGGTGFNMRWRVDSEKRP